MVKRGGYISIYSLIIMVILMLITSYLIYAINLENHITINTMNNIQAYYLAEGKINMMLYDRYFNEEFYPYLVEAFKDEKFITTKEIILDGIDLDEYESPVKIILSLEKKNNRAEFGLTSESDYKGIRTSIIAIGTAVNDFFELGIPILSPHKIEEDSSENFYKLLNKIFDEINVDFNNLPSNTYGSQFNNFEKFNLNQIDYNIFYLYAFRDTMVEPYIEHINKENIVLVMKKYLNNNVELVIGNEEELNKPIEINGLILIEGNITIFNKLNFNGIIILRDGNIIVRSDEKPLINGLIISSNNLNENDIDVIYNVNYIYKYGIYLPGFIEPNMVLLKGN